MAQFYKKTIPINQTILLADFKQSIMLERKPQAELSLRKLENKIGNSKSEIRKETLTINAYVVLKLEY